MNNLERAAHRANLGLLLSGLVCLTICSAIALSIWTDLYSGPDLRSEFILMLVPFFALGAALAIWGTCELGASKTKAKAVANS